MDNANASEQSRERETFIIIICRALAHAKTRTRELFLFHFFPLTNYLIHCTLSRLLEDALHHRSLQAHCIKVEEKALNERMWVVNTLFLFSSFVTIHIDLCAYDIYGMHNVSGSILKYIGSRFYEKDRLVMMDRDWIK